MAVEYAKQGNIEGVLKTINDASEVGESLQFRHLTHLYFHMSDNGHSDNAAQVLSNFLFEGYFYGLFGIHKCSHLKRQNDEK